MLTKKGMSSRKKILIALSIVASLVIIAGILELTGVTDFYHKAPTPQQQAAQDREKKANVTGQIDSQNQNSSNNTSTSSNDKTAGSTDQTDTSSAGKLKQATPVLTQSGIYDGQVVAAGYVGDVYEDGGTCTYNFTNGSATISQTVAGAENVSNTSCGSVSVDKSQFANGAWTVSLNYMSSTSTGTSGSGKFNVN